MTASRTRLLLLAAACLASAAFASAALAQPSFADAPTIVRNPNRTVPLAAVVRFTSSEPVRTEIAIEDGVDSTKIAFPIGRDPAAGLPILGLRPGSEARLTITIRDRSGKAAASAPLTYRVPDLPAVGLTWPKMETNLASGERIEPGWRLISVRRRVPGRQSFQSPAQQRFARRWGLVIALDPAGQVRWYYENPGARMAGIKPLDDGTLMYTTEDQRVVVIDMLGNVLKQWYAEKRPQGPAPGATPIAGLQTLHHEPSPTPWGTYISMSANARLVRNYYTSVTDPNAPRKDTMVMGDRIIEFDRDGRVVWQWNAFDHLDPARVNFHLLQPYWEVRGFPGHADWTHGNGIAFDERNDMVIVSLKHQDALIGIDRRTGSIKWIFGEPTGWSPQLQRLVLKPVGLLRYPYSMHHPHVTPQGTLVYYDNGMLQARPFTGKTPVPFAQTFSRAVEVKIDSRRRTVTELWTSDTGLQPDTCNNWAMGDAWRMPITANMLVIRSFCPQLSDKLQHDNEFDFSRRFVDDAVYYGRIDEYTRTAPARLASRVSFSDPDDLIQWQLYGGFHTPSLYWDKPAGKGARDRRP